jgi:coatomer subunit beta
LAKIVQLTGFSDAIYAEAYVTVHQYDISLDVLLINQTPQTLQNLTLELSTLGDLKLCEKPTSVTLGPHAFNSLRATIKVSSTESAVIFGSLTYDGPATNFNCVILKEICIDVMDYIKPMQITESEFRTMWSEFEWENKVNVNTNMTYSILTAVT